MKKNKNKDVPHERRRGFLKNGNPGGNLDDVARCGSKTRNGLACVAPAMKNGRCRLHGGKSTGPRTEEGRARSRSARLIHGYYSLKAVSERKRIRKLFADFRQIIKKSNREDQV